MAKPLKQFVILLSATLAVFVGLCGFTYLTYRIRGYQYRYLECDPRELLADLERVSDVNFPVDIQNVKAARTVPIEGDFLFILKFTCKPDVLNAFLESLPDEALGVELQPYNAEDDLRKAGFWPPPRWFTEAIDEGNEGLLLLDNRRAQIYVDTTNEKQLVIYMRGSYPQRAAEQNP